MRIHSLSRVATLTLLLVACSPSADSEPSEHDAAVALASSALNTTEANMHVRSLNSNGSIGAYADYQKWTDGWDTTEVFNVGAKTFLFLLKSSDGVAHIQKMNDNGSVGDRVATYQWTAGWTAAQFYSIGSATYLLLLKEGDGSVHIHKMNTDGSVGDMTKNYDWTRGWKVARTFHPALAGTTLQKAIALNQQHLLLVNPTTGEVHVNKLEADGTVGLRTFDATWTAGWTTAELFEVGEKLYLFIVKEATGEAQVREMILSNGELSIGSKLFGYNWSSGWTNATFYVSSNITYLLLYKEGDGTAHLHAMNVGGAVGMQQPEPVLRSGWSSFEPFRIGSKLYLFSMQDGPDAIGDKWTSMAGAYGSLGNPLAVERVAADGGRARDFEGGSIYWHRSTGAHEVHAPILRAKYQELGAEIGPLGYPTTDNVADTTFQRKNVFQNGTVRTRFVNAPLSVYAQNAAFIGDDLIYAGYDKTESKQALIDYLKSTKPDVVGLGEMFVDSIRSQVVSEVAIIYPYRVDPPSDSDISPQQDGGILLLSKYPFSFTERTIYRSCAGIDCAADKGVSYARVVPPTGPSYDVFLSHTQDPDASSSAPNIVFDQLDNLHSFSAAERKRQIYPSIVMGDLNVDGSDPELYADLMSTFDDPLDLWKVSHPTWNGFTFDDVGDFESNAAGVSSTDPSQAPRGLSGQRLDYLLADNGQNWSPRVFSTSLVNVQTRSKRDMSDHYGLLTRFGGADELQVEYADTSPFDDVTIALTKFHCLEVTDGPFSDDDDDEMRWSLKAKKDGGAYVTKVSADYTAENDSIHSISGLSIALSNVASQVVIRVEAQEIDDGSALSFPAQEIVLGREELLHAIYRAKAYGFGVFEADDGEYTATVEVRVQ